MPGPKDLDPSSSPRAMMGAELRHARERVGLSQDELGQPLFVSGSFIGQLEAGTRRMHLEYARQIPGRVRTLPPHHPHGIHGSPRPRRSGPRGDGRPARETTRVTHPVRSGPRLIYKV